MDKSKATAVCCSILLFGTVACASAAHAEYRCESPQSHFDRIACEKAKQSPTALRQFIQRIRSIESLHYYDYVGPRGTTAATEQEPSIDPAPQRLAQLPR